MRGGSLLVLRNPDDFGAVAQVGGEVLFARTGAFGTATIEAYDPETRQTRRVFSLPRRAGLLAEVTSLLPFVNGEAVVAVVAYRDVGGERVDYQVVLRDDRRGVTELLYARSAATPDLQIDALDWSLRNEIFLYEHRSGEVSRWLGDIVRVTMFPRAVVNVSERDGVRGLPSVDPSGRRLAVVSGPDEIRGQPYHIELLDLDDGGRRTIFERFGAREVIFDGRPTMTATRVQWAPDETAVVFVDSDHGADVAPAVTRLALGAEVGRMEQRVSDAGEALAVLLSDSQTALVLYRRTSDEQFIVEETTLGSSGSRIVLTSPEPVAMLGVRPG